MAGELAYSLKEVWKGLVILVTGLISGMKRVEMCEVRDDSRSFESSLLRSWGCSPNYGVAFQSILMAPNHNVRKAQKPILKA